MIAVDLLTVRRSACSRLGVSLETDEDTTAVVFEGDVMYEVPRSSLIRCDDRSEAEFRRWLTGLAVLWLAERHAYPQLLEGRWDVVASDGSIGSTVLVEGRDGPLVAMLDAIEEWDETPAHSNPGLELYDEGGDR